MQSVTRVASLLLLGACLSSQQQNLVMNGDFRAGLTGWTLGGGYSCTPGIETFDVGGLGPVPCFACGPGGMVTPAPYPPNTLEQQVPFVPSITYELTADIATKHEHPSLANGDAGRVRVDVNGVTAGSYNFATGAGNIPAQGVWRAKLCLRFTTTAAGLVPLTFNFERSALCGANLTPRVRITNIVLSLVPSSPTFSVNNNLRLGRTLAFQVRGAPQAPFVVLVAPLLFVAPIQIPGIGGMLFLDPTAMLSFWNGALDASGSATTSIPIPVNPYLTLAPTWFQPAQVAAASQPALGTHHYFVFTSY